MAKKEFLNLAHDYNDDIVNYFTGYLTVADLNNKIKFVVLGDAKQKKLIDLKIAQPHVKSYSNIDLFIIVNHEVFELLEDNDKIILVDEALCGLHYDLDKEVLKLSPSNVNTFVAKKYGVDVMIRTKKLVEETFSQIKDKNKEK